MTRTQHEAAEQVALFEWAELMRGQYPELEWMYHIPNGGSRNPIEAANLKRQGVKPGVLDIFLSVARGGYHGLYIEMKYGKNKPTADQRRWLAGLSRNGYAVTVCYSWQAAAEKIVKYLELEREK